MAWNALDALNRNAKAAVTDDKPKARFRIKDISIRRMYSNDANFYSMPDIEQLAQKIYAVGLLENLTVVHDPCGKGEYRIIAGERRWRALCLLVEQGHSEFEVASCQIKTPAEEHEEMVQLIIANAYRNKTVKDILEEEQKLKETLQYMRKNKIPLQGYELDSGRLRDVIAEMLNMPTTKVAQIESINKRLIPEFTDELRNGDLTFSAAYELSGMEEDGQKELLERYKDTGLTFKEVKEAKRQQEEKATAEQVSGQLTIAEMIESQISEENNQTEPETKEDQEADAWEDAHPESIISLCYSCSRYSECNVKTGTCQKCDQYRNKTEAEKTPEQRYDEQQEAIDRETKRKLQEQEKEEKMQQLPSKQEKTVHDVKLGASFFEDVRSGRKNFELRKNDRNYKTGDLIVLHEYKDGKETGRSITKEIGYMLEDFEGLKDGYCILGLAAVGKTLQDADNRTLEYGA